MQTAPKKILVVDDEKDLRDALSSALSSAGYFVIKAENGEMGLKEAETHKPDLILLDISMPRMNGHQMLHSLRRQPWGKDTPVLMLTNSDDPANIVQGVSLKSNDYIIKSQISLELVVKKVKQHLAGYHD